MFSRSPRWPSRRRDRSTRTFETCDRSLASTYNVGIDVDSAGAPNLTGARVDSKT